MRGFTKLMLGLLIANTVAAALFLTGVVDVSKVPGFYLAFPLAAIFYGLFLIGHALDKEVAAFDAEQGAPGGHAAPEAHPPNVEHLPREDHHESIAA